MNLVICFQSLTFPKLLNNLRFYTTAQIYHLFRAFSTRTNLILFGYSVKHRHRMISLSILFTTFWEFIMCPTYKFFLLTFDCYSPQTVNTTWSGAPSAMLVFGAYHTMIAFSNSSVSLVSVALLWNFGRLITNLPVFSW